MAQTKAREEPVLPPVYSTTVKPGRRSPRASASSIIASAIRSLYDPVGLKYSSLTSTSALLAGTTLCSRTTGVFPMACSVESQTPGGLLCMCPLLYVVKWVEKLRQYNLSLTYHSAK